MTALTQPNDLLWNETLREKSRQLREYSESIFENAPVMMHSIDKDGRIVAVNRKWLQRLGYEKDEVLGKKSVDFLAHTSRARAATDTLPLFWQSGSARSVGYRFLTKSGDPVDLMLDAVACPPGTGARATFAALYKPEDLTQWGAASDTLHNLLQLALEQEKCAVGGPAHRPPSRLTERELEVLRYLASGNRNKEIAEYLSLSVRTVRFHIENLYRKLGVSSRTQAVRRASERGYLKPI